MSSYSEMGSVWTKSFRSESGQKVGFAAVFNLKEEMDLIPFARRMPEGIVLCSPRLMAGIPHLERVLEQAFQYWERGLTLARNKSIDLLMRITCQSQIAEAVKISGLAAAATVAVLGLCGSEKEAEEILFNLSKELHEPQRKDSLLEIDDSKTKFLAELHNLPKSVGKSQLASLLSEKSVNLIFAK